MKTTLDMHDERDARETARPLRVVVADGNRRVVEAAAPRSYELPDLRVGDSDAPDPLETCSWPRLRELIYYGLSQSWHR